MHWSISRYQYPLQLESAQIAKFKQQNLNWQHQNPIFSRSKIERKELKTVIFKLKIWSLFFSKQRKLSSIKKKSKRNKRNDLDLDSCRGQIRSVHTKSKTIERRRLETLTKKYQRKRGCKMGNFERERGRVKFEILREWNWAGKWVAKGAAN